MDAITTEILQNRRKQGVAPNENELRSYIGSSAKNAGRVECGPQHTETDAEVASFQHISLLAHELALLSSCFSGLPAYS